MFSFQSFKSTEGGEDVAEEVKKVKIDEGKPKETQLEEVVDEVGWELPVSQRGMLSGCSSTLPHLNGHHTLGKRSVQFSAIWARCKPHAPVGWGWAANSQG